MTLHYLAYGSNLHPQRLIERVPSASLVGVVELPGWTLNFHKRGADGSAKCDLVQVPQPSLCFAALYTLQAAHKPLLDEVEGLGSGYRLCWMPCRFQGRSYQAFAYRASATHIEAELRPYRWYRDLVLDGARFLGFAEHYVASIRKVAVVEDPDRRRNAAHQALRARMAAYSGSVLRSTADPTGGCDADC